MLRVCVKFILNSTGLDFRFECMCGWRHGEMRGCNEERPV